MASSCGTLLDGAPPPMHSCRLVPLDLIDLGPPLAYTEGVHVVVESPDFAADAKAAGLDEEDVRRIIDLLAPPRCR